MANPLSDFNQLIDRSDLDGLVRTVDDLCSSRDWSSLLQLRNSCRLATASGKQLWPASTLAEYRLALLAPAHIAAQVLEEGSGRFTLGPLTEVIAQNHQWSDLQHELPPSPIASFVAHECAMRGQHIENSADVFDALETPLELQSWEPTYELAVYRDNSAEFPSPELPPTSATRVVTAATSSESTTVQDNAVVDAVHQLVGAWTTSSNGTLQVVAARGDESHALASLGITRQHCARFSQLMHWHCWLGPVQVVAHLVGVVVQPQGVMARGGCLAHSRGVQINGHSKTTRLAMR